MTSNLNNKTVIVTGSTTGIGRAIARRCAALGANVLVHGRDAGRGAELVEELAPRARLHTDDLVDPEAPRRIVQAAVDAFGSVDALVNNAAWIVRSDLDSTDATFFDKVMAINVRAPLLLIQEALPYLRKVRGVVANIGSINALGGERNLLAYSVSKGALLTLSKNVADALAAEQVRVVHFNVGWVLTENEYHYKLADGLGENWPERVSATDVPRGKMTTPEEVASVVAFWLTDAARPFSGTVMELEQYPFAGRNPTREGSAEEPAN